MSKSMIYLFIESKTAPYIYSIRVGVIGWGKVDSAHFCYQVVFCATAQERNSHDRRLFHSEVVL